MVAGLLMLLLAMMPPLTDAQREQLSTARDMSADWDEPALYPLLHHVAAWPPGSEAGAAVPDYDTLHRNPAAHRGDVFLIEGQLAGPPQVVKRSLSRPGPWDDNLQQWSVLVRRDPDEVAVVLLVDPMPPDEMPTKGGPRVRIAGRFFKVWQFVDIQGQPTPYLMFVGRSVKVEGGAATVAPADAAPNRMLPLLLIVPAMLAGWFMMRRVVRLSRQPRMSSSRRPREDVTPADGLPDDPADALRALEQRHDQSRNIE